MDRFVVILTTTQQNLANKACGALEEAGIPVMLEHVEIHEAGLRASGFRLLVPSQLTQRARKVADSASAAAFHRHSSGYARQMVM